MNIRRALSSLYNLTTTLASYAIDMRVFGRVLLDQNHSLLDTLHIARELFNISGES